MAAYKNISIADIQLGQYIEGNLYMDYLEYYNSPIEERPAFWENLPLTNNYTETFIRTYYDSSHNEIFHIEMDYMKTGNSSEDYCDGYIYNGDGQSINFMWDVPNNAWNIDDLTLDYYIDIKGIIDSYEDYDSASTGEPSPFISPEFNSFVSTSIEINGLYTLCNKIYSKLYRMNKKLDYYLSIASTVVNPSYNTTANYSGVTVAASNITLIGNTIHLDVRFTLTTTAQNNLGTGNITNTKLCTFTISSFRYASATSLDSTNLNKISNIGDNGALVSGYSSGNGCPASAHYDASYSGNTVTITVTLDALYAKSSEFRFAGLIPVTRVPSYYENLS